MAYTYKIVYKNLEEDLRKRIISMWIDNNVLDVATANFRVDQVVLVGFDSNDEVCCVTTVYEKELASTERWYIFRMYIRPQDRGRITEFKSSKVTHEFLSQYQRPGKPKGILAFAENQKITQRIMKWEGWNYYGKAPNGQDIYFVEFAGN